MTIYSGKNAKTKNLKVLDSEEKQEDPRGKLKLEGTGVLSFQFLLPGFFLIIGSSGI